MRNLLFLSNVVILGSFLLIGCLVFWCWGLFNWQMSFNLLSYLGSDMGWLVRLDSISILCLFMLFCCGSLALLYCHHYFGGDRDGFLLFPVVVWFLGVMGSLIVSSSLVLTLVFWEYLGLVSFFLILFYSNMYSLRASLITLFASRFGDVALFLIIMWVCWWGELSSVVISFLLALVIMTKSACYPFVSWLLEAMRAPTPVSSLVHSSTLVAAGVWFLLRYDSLCGLPIKGFLFFMCLITIVITGCCAILFDDLKKIVALSTCNNVSWCIIFFIMGDLGLCLLQLLTHGVCKCYLFMSVGDLMSQSGSSQSSVGVYLGRYVGAWGTVVQTLLILSLCGMPFLGVFFSKHGLFSLFFYSYGVGSVVVLMIGFLLTCVYSIRFTLLLLSVCGGLVQGYASSFYLISGVSFLGSLLNYLGGAMLDEVFEAGLVGGATLLCFQVGGALLGLLAFFFRPRQYDFWCSVLWGSDIIVRSLYSFFVGLSEGSIMVLYRWEIYLVGVCSSVSRSVFSFSIFSFNMMVCLLLLIIFIYCFFW